MRFRSHLLLLILLSLDATEALSWMGDRDACFEPIVAKEPRQAWKGPWQGELSDGTHLSRKELDDLLTVHAAWLQHAELKLNKERAKAVAKRENEEAWITRLIASDWEKAGGRLVLKEAKLGEVNLEGAKLQFANLEGAYLHAANLERAALVGANLTEAFLGFANLRRANFNEANLQHTGLYNTNLNEAQLSEANLKGAVLSGACLQAVDLYQADLDLADFYKADMREAVYEPKSGVLPKILTLRTARNMETMRFERTPHALEELKQAFRKTGYLQQEREVTHAIKRSEQQEAWLRGDRIEPMFKYVLFELPIAYGLYPGRALRILGLLIPMFAVPYGLAIVRPFRNHSIYRISPKERIEMDVIRDTIKIDRLNSQDLHRVVVYALYFSLLSAFNIGWRDLNVGNWINRLQFTPYTLQATGWVRSISGLQSLISVYLLAMWALSYFGRPFE